jgi:glycosyltransferase involved in cell wall biosynthesis
MKVVHLLPHARALGGTERTVLSLLAAPELAHVEQRVAFVQPGRVIAFPRSAVLGRRAGRVVPAAALPAILRWRPDIVHGWLLQGNLLGAALKPLLPGAVLITSERHSDRELGGVRPVLERIVAHAEDVGTGNSSAVRAAVVGRVPSRGPRFRVILPGVAAPVVTQAARSSTVVMVGRVHSVKDHATALRAWRQVIERYPGARLTIVGGGSGLRELRQTASQMGLGATVTFRGDVDPASDLAGAQMFLSTSRAEGFSRAVVEALAAGVPVISTDVGGIAELRGDAVRVAAIGDDAEIAGHILAWLDDPAARRAAAAAAERLSRRFAPAECHATYARLYAELLSRA